MPGEPCLQNARSWDHQMKLLYFKNVFKKWLLEKFGKAYQWVDLKKVFCLIKKSRLKKAKIISWESFAENQHSRNVVRFFVNKCRIIALHFEHFDLIQWLEVDLSGAMCGWTVVHCKMKRKTSHHDLSTFTILVFARGTPSFHYPYCDFVEYSGCCKSTPLCWFCLFFPLHKFTSLSALDLMNSQSLIFPSSTFSKNSLVWRAQDQWTSCSTNNIFFSLNFFPIFFSFFNHAALKPGKWFCSTLN